MTDILIRERVGPQISLRESEGGSPPAGSDIGLNMQPQLQSNWCWSATTVSVALYYSASASWTQCSLANAELGQSTCCTNGSSAACNRPWTLDTALNRVGRLNRWSSGTQPFTTIRSEVQAKRAFACRIGWNGGGGHFVVASGYSGGSRGVGSPPAPPMVRIQDSALGPSTVPYSALVKGYNSTGSWTHSYFTQ